MRQISVVCLLLAGSLMASGPDKAAEQTLIQMEKDWNQALMAKDFKALDRIMAEEWAGIDFRGMSVTKAESIAELKSGESGNQSVELGDIQVKVYGTTAVVIGRDTEKSTYHGKDSSGSYVWMDVFVLRNGRWQAVASESTKVAK